MARSINEIPTAWRALDSNTSSDGWRTIPITGAYSSIMMAARHFPDNMEALLVGFTSTALPKAEKLPEANGFSVVRLTDQYDKDMRLWLALSRRESGNVGLFRAMVMDVVQTLDDSRSDDGQRHLQLFLSRLRAWQEFMRKGPVALGPEAEVGLIGELRFLDLRVRQGTDPWLALEAWRGPPDAPQDFILGTGAVEIKSTIAQVGFPAKIGSLEQLDGSVLSPLFLAGQRFVLSDSGKRLPEWVEQVATTLGNAGSLPLQFMQRLLAAGYVSAHDDHYTRRFAFAQTRLIMIDASFPRLIPGTVPKGVRKAVYEIDLDQVENKEHTINSVLKKVGVA